MKGRSLGRLFLSVKLQNEALVEDCWTRTHAQIPSSALSAGEG